jgi:hypothetical protein
MSEWDNIPWEYSRSGKTQTAVVNGMILRIAKHRGTLSDPWHWRGKPYVWSAMTLRGVPQKGDFGRAATLEEAIAATIAEAKETTARLEVEQKALSIPTRG